MKICEHKNLFRPLLVASSAILTFYVIFLMRYAVVIILEKKFFFPIKRKQGVNNSFKSLISSDFTPVGPRLKSEQKGKEKINLETKYNTI